MVLAVPASAQLQPVSAESRLTIGGQNLGDSFADLVYTPLTPCRIIDTRVAGGFLSAGAQRSFLVKGTDGFQTQGGTMGGCGVPANATAVLLNFVAVGPEGVGNLKGAAYPNAIPATGSILNYQALTPALNIANAVAFPVCDVSVNTCPFDLTLLANASGTHVVVDALGYFRRFPKEQTITSVIAGSGLSGGGNSGDVTLEIGNGAITPAKIQPGLAGTVLATDPTGTSAAWTPAVKSLGVGSGLTENSTTGNVSIWIPNLGIAGSMIADAAVSGPKIQNGAVTAPHIASGQVVKGVNSLTDGVTIAGAGGAVVSTTGNTITVNTSSLAAPAGSIILGTPGDTTLIGAGYTEIGDSGTQMWRPTSTTGVPPARTSPTAVWTGTKMIVWGGSYLMLGLIYYTNTGGLYDPATNSWATTSLTNAPSARGGHTAVWTGTRMIVWGGRIVGGSTNTGGIYDPVANSWTATDSAGAPTARSLHTAVWTGSRMIVWGGGGSGIENSGGIYDPDANSWTAMSAGTQLARYCHTAVWTGSRMIVWGGISASGYDNTGGIYDPVANLWSATSITGVPAPRAYHSAVWTGVKMIVWGGQNASGYENSGGIFDPSMGTWAATSTTGALSPRQNHTAIWNGTKMVVWGGYDNTYLNSGGIYDPAPNSWMPTSLVGVPAMRASHAAVWTGTRMIVWGGYAGSYLNTGGQWIPLSLYQKN